MRADLLRDNFETLIRTSEDVETIEVAILKMAMQGKLVPQNPDDEPAKLPHKRAAKRRKAPSNETTTTEVMLPPGWDRARLSEIFELQYGKGLPKKVRDSEGAIPVYGSNGVIGHHSESLVDTECIVVGRKGSAGAVNLSLEPCWVIDTAYYVVPPDGLDLRFTFYLLRSLGLDELGRGIKPGLSRRDAYEIELSIPPLAEQKRVVTRVDEILTKAHRLAEVLETTDELLEPVAQASYQALVEAQDAAARHEAWQRVLDGFEVLTSDPRTVDVLKQTILGLAVQGVLVPQDAADEPAHLLLQRIIAEKQALSGGGASARQEGLLSVKLDHSDQSLPSGWAGAELQDIAAEVLTGPFGSNLHKSDYVEEGIPVINPASISEDGIEPVPGMAVSEATKQRLSGYILKEGDILLARRGEMGRCAVVGSREAGWLCGTGSLIIRLSKEVDPDFIAQTIRSPQARSYLEDASVGTTMSNLNQKALNRMRIALPPLVEQTRIVEKVKSLTNLCEVLALEMNATNEVRTQIRNSLISFPSRNGQHTCLKS